MILVVDASVAVKWFVEEERREHASDILRDDFDLIAPDLLLTEVANAMRNKVRLGLMTMEQARTALSSLPGLFDRLTPASDTVAEAFEMACRINHPVADCVYLSCARLAGATLLTDDETLFLKAKNLDGAADTIRLGDWALGRSATPTG